MIRRLSLSFDAIGWRRNLSVEISLAKIRHVPSSVPNPLLVPPPGDGHIVSALHTAHYLPRQSLDGNNWRLPSASMCSTFSQMPEQFARPNNNNNNNKSSMRVQKLASSAEEP